MREAPPDLQTGAPRGLEARAHETRADESPVDDVRGEGGRADAGGAGVPGPPSVHVRIERLVLEGLPLTRAQGEQVGAALEAELSRLLAEGRLDPALLASGALPALPAGPLRLDADTSPARLGRQIARAIHEGISR